MHFTLLLFETALATEASQGPAGGKPCCDCCMSYSVCQCLDLAYLLGLLSFHTRLPPVSASARGCVLVKRACPARSGDIPSITAVSLLSSDCEKALLSTADLSQTTLPTCSPGWGSAPKHGRLSVVRTRAGPHSASPVASWTGCQ